MNLAVITKNTAYQTLLSNALRPFVAHIVLYDDIKAEFKVDMVLCVSDGNFDENLEKLSKKIPVFVIGKINKDLLQSATDYFGAPIRLGRLIEAVKHQIKYQAQKEKLKPVNFGDFTLDPKTNELINSLNNTSVLLTEKEQEILLYLYDYKFEGIKRERLLKDIWGYVDGVETHTLETHIYRLRKKIEEDPTIPQILITDEDGYHLQF